jgi:hypothetical protein
VTRRDRSFVVYVCSKGTHSCIHPFVYFLRREGGGFPSRMLTSWVSVKDDQGGTSNSRSFLSIRATVSPIRLAVAWHLRNMIPEDPLLVAVFVVLVLVLLSDFPAREM